MKRLIFTCIFAVVGCARPVLGQSAPVTCAAASTPLTQQLTPFITRVVSGTSEQAIAQRSRMHLPSAPASEVLLIQDAAICQSASQSFARAVLTDTTRILTPMVVLRIGPRYVVTPAVRHWNLHPVTVFDSSFVFRAFFAF